MAYLFYEIYFKNLKIFNCLIYTSIFYYIYYVIDIMKYIFVYMCIYKKILIIE